MHRDRIHRQRRGKLPKLQRKKVFTDKFNCFIDDNVILGFPSVNPTSHSDVKEL